VWNPVPASALPRWERLAAAAVDFLVLLVPEFVLFDLVAGGAFSRYAHYLRLHPTAGVARAVHAAPGIQAALERVVVLSELVTALYLIACVLAFGGTVGKLLLGLRVTGVGGGRLSPRDAALRSTAFWVPAMLTNVVPLLGFALWVAVYGGGTVMLLTRPDRRAIEDWLGRSMVVYRTQVGSPLAALAGLDRSSPPVGGSGPSVRPVGGAGGHLPGWGPEPQPEAEPAPPPEGPPAES